MSVRVQRSEIAPGARPTPAASVRSLLLSRLPHPVSHWLLNARTVLRHPTALTTIGAVFRRSLEADAETPWWNDRAIRYLDQRLSPGDLVFEWGSGASTIWLVSRGAEVISVEHDRDWVSKVAARCPAADIRAVPENASDYAAAIDEFEDGSFDVVIVDGRFREECLRRGAPKVRPGGLLVLDDSDIRRLRPLRKSLPGWERTSFTGFKATTDVRETTFFRHPK